MTTLIDDTFVRFLKNLEIDPPSAFELRRDEQRVRDCLSCEFRITNTCIGGAYARTTLIPPLSGADINIQVFVDPADFSRKAHVETLDRTRRLLSQTFGAGHLSRNGRAVNVPSGDYSLDVIPLFTHPDGGVLIPDARNERWLRTDPDRHIEMWSEFDRAHLGRFIPLVRMLKVWNRGQGDRFSSFHLECLVRSAYMRRQIPDYPAAVLHFFEHAEKHIGAPLTDPAGYSGEVGDISPSEIPSLQRTLSAAHTVATSALAIDAQLMPSEASVIWRGLFGDLFPES